jgi:hypothetical protein
VKDARTNTADYFVKQQAPRPGSIHNPLPADRVLTPNSYISRPSAYVPYIGTMPVHVEQLLSANSTYSKIEYNSTNTGFQIVLTRSLPYALNYLDPRTGSFLETELERIWGGPSPRIDITTGQLLNSDLSSGLNFDQRSCSDFLLWRSNSSNIACSNPDAGCCPDFNSENATVFMQYGKGLWPGLCINGCETFDRASSYERYPLEVPSSDALIEEWLT